MTQTNFDSPIRRETTLKLPANSWNDIRTLIEGRTSPGLVDGRHHSHLVARWRADNGGMTAHRRVLDEGSEVTVEAVRPATQEQAAQLGAMMIYAARSGQRVGVELLAPNSRMSYRELVMQSCAWSVGRLGSGIRWPIRPTGFAGVEVGFPDMETDGSGASWSTYALGDVPSIMSEGYSKIFEVPREDGEAAFAGMVGAPDFETATAAFREGQAADTPYEAAHVALGVLIAHHYSA